MRKNYVKSALKHILYFAEYMWYKYSKHNKNMISKHNFHSEI